MIKDTIHIEKTFGDVNVTFVFKYAVWYENHPYGSTTASEQFAEVICEHIWVNGQDISEDDLIKMSGESFDPDIHWEQLEEEALNKI